MGYYIDLKKISIDQYKKKLRSADLIPSWRMLKENIDKNFDIIKSCRIRNLYELLEKVKNKDRIQEFEKKTSLSENYLSLLRRVLYGYQPKPNKIRDFCCISRDTVKKLEVLGFKNTLHLYAEILTPQKRNAFSNKNRIAKDEVTKLAKLADLSRIRWVNHTFANVLLEAGYDTAKKVADADYKKMYEKIIKLNKGRKLYKGNIGEHDMKLCVEASHGLDFEVVL